MPLKSSSVMYLSTTPAKLKFVFNRLRSSLHMLNIFLYEPPGWVLVSLMDLMMKHLCSC